MRFAWSLVALGGCFGDNAIELTYQAPAPDVAAQFDTSCITAVELDLDGGNYPNDGTDYTVTCVDIPGGQPTFEAVRQQIAGKFDVKLPASGLSGVELYGFAGRCAADRVQDFDLLFYASSPYIGGNQVYLPIVPNLSCAPRDVTVRPVDVLKLVATKTCAQAAWTQGRLALSTLSPLAFTDQLYWWGGQAAANVVGGVATIHGNTSAGSRSCLAAGLYTTDWEAVTCFPPADQQLCANAGELEAPMVDLGVAAASQDQMLVTQWGAMAIGAVLTGAPIAPVAGATVTVDAADQAHATIVFLDMPPGVENGTGALTARAGSTTGPSGLFAVYTESLVHITITANGKTVHRVIAAESAKHASSILVRM